jgi:hypothetical protein
VNSRKSLLNLAKEEGLTQQESKEERVKSSSAPTTNSSAEELRMKGLFDFIDVGIESFRKQSDHSPKSDLSDGDLGAQTSKFGHY